MYWTVWTVVVDDMLVFKQELHNFHDLFAAQKMHLPWNILYYM